MNKQAMRQVKFTYSFQRERFGCWPCGTIIEQGGYRGTAKSSFCYHCSDLVCEWCIISIGCSLSLYIYRHTYYQSLHPSKSLYLRVELASCNCQTPTSGRPYYCSHNYVNEMSHGRFSTGKEERLFTFERGCHL